MPPIGEFTTSSWEHADRRISFRATIRELSLGCFGVANVTLHYDRSMRRNPVAWTGHEGLGYRLACRMTPLEPAVLLVSLPRSGSSWIGGVLGSAPNSLYLREPLNESHQSAGVRETVFEINDRTPPPPDYEMAARYAFVGFPRFSRDVVVHPDQWALSRRRRSRVVVKEVNPLACHWFVEQFQPRVILLVRHPGAIAESYLRKGWTDSEPRSWRWLGNHFGRALQEARASLERHGDFRIVEYETICRDPFASFRSLFEFAGLDWPDSHAAIAGERESGWWSEMSRRPGVTTDDLIHGWRSRLPIASLRELERAYRDHDVPWYQSDSDWMLADGLAPTPTEGQALGRQPRSA
jgi:hypothetical protein